MLTFGSCFSGGGMTSKPRYGSLFSGIGGMDLGLDRAGWECAFQVEIDPFCRKVLEKHWPDVPKWSDIREVKASEVPTVDLLAGGFPCQDTSLSNPKGKGIKGERSGLWGDFFRLVCEIRPRYVLLENSPGLLRRGFGRLLGDLASVGFDAEWEVLSACAFGAPHTRERLFVVAYSAGFRGERRVFHSNGRESPQGRAEGERELHPTPTKGHLPAAPWNTPEPAIRGVAYGISKKVGFSLLGNAVVPQVAEWIGRRLIAVARGEDPNAL